MASKSETSRKDRTNVAETESGARGRERPESRNVVERGDIFFFYRPASEDAVPGGLLDVNRFHVVLRPEGSDVLRYLTIGKKMLPGDGGGDRNWGFVDGVFGDAEELRQALAGAKQGGPARAAAVPAGEGVYALARRGRNTVLAYALELPEEPGEVQQTFHIGRQGRLTLAIKNPEAGSPAGVGLDDDRRVEFPDELQERFGGRKWLPADPPAFLDYPGAELVLIADNEEGEDLGIELEPQPETEEDAEVFNDLHLDCTERTIRPLFEGTWA